MVARISGCSGSWVLDKGSLFLSFFSLNISDPFYLKIVLSTFSGFSVMPPPRSSHFGNQQAGLKEGVPVI